MTSPTPDLPADPTVAAMLAKVRQAISDGMEKADQSSDNHVRYHIVASLSELLENRQIKYFSEPTVETFESSSTVYSRCGRIHTLRVKFTASSKEYVFKMSRRRAKPKILRKIEQVRNLMYVNVQLKPVLPINQIKLDFTLPQGELQDV